MTSFTADLSELVSFPSDRMCHMDYRKIWRISVCIFRGCRVKTGGPVSSGLSGRLPAKCRENPSRNSKNDLLVASCSATLAKKWHKLDCSYNIQLRIREKARNIKICKIGRVTRWYLTFSICLDLGSQISMGQFFKHRHLRNPKFWMYLMHTFESYMKAA